MALLPILVAGCNPDQLRGLLNVALASPGAAGTPTAGPTQTPGASVPADNSGPGASSKLFNPPKWAIGKWKSSPSGSTVVWTIAEDDITGDGLDLGALKRDGAVTESLEGTTYRLKLRASAKGAGSYIFARGYSSSYLAASGFVPQDDSESSGQPKGIALMQLYRDGSPPPDADEDDEESADSAGAPDSCFGCATPTPCYKCGTGASTAPKPRDTPATSGTPAPPSSPIAATPLPAPSDPAVVALTVGVSATVQVEAWTVQSFAVPVVDGRAYRILAEALEGEAVLLIPDDPYDAGGVRLGDTVYDDGSGKTRTTLKATKSGTAYFGVRGFGFTAGKFKVTVSEES